MSNIQKAIFTYYDIWYIFNHISWCFGTMSLMEQLVWFHPISWNIMQSQISCCHSLTLCTSNIANLHLQTKCRSIFVLTVWNKWITTTINVKSQSQFKQVIKVKMLASYSNSVRCANLHCTDGHGQSVYSS